MVAEHDPDAHMNRSSSSPLTYHNRKLTLQALHPINCSASENFSTHSASLIADGLDLGFLDLLVPWCFLLIEVFH